MKKYLGLDLGTTTLGIAKSDLMGFVFPKEEFKFDRGNYRAARKRVAQIMQETGINSIVIGYPVQLDGIEGERCKSVERFCRDLRDDVPGVLIFYWNESYSTIEAHDRLRDSGYKEDKIKDVIDMYSAVVILEDYLRNKPYDRRNY
jgi:RNAse H-fold protein YqgF